MNAFIELLKTIWDWFVNSGLAEKTADVFGRILTFDSEELLELMWDFINTIFPNGVGL